MDTISPKRRSANMRAICSKDTSPEIIVRRTAHGLGFRFRLHNSLLPGKPDLVFAKHRKAIFVHGCFWHLHRKVDCLDGRRPKSNRGYWKAKLDRNVARDAEHLLRLKELGWKVLVVWECETNHAAKLRARITRFLEGGIPVGAPDYKVRRKPSILKMRNGAAMRGS